MIRNQRDANYQLASNHALNDVSDFSDYEERNSTCEIKGREERN